MTHRLFVLIPLIMGCSVDLPLPQGQLTEIAEEVCKVGHPTVKFEGARIVDFETGWLSSSRSVDLAIDYRGVLAKKTKTLTVRFHVDSLDPCEVHTEVLSDTGTTPPLLLDNWVASPLVGQKVCTAFDQ